MHNNMITIEQLFGTLQQSVVATWRKHLRTAKYAKHIALNEFYEKMPELVDALIEAWMGANGKKIKGYENILQSSNMNTLTYLKELKKLVRQGYELVEDNEELESHLDDIMELINSTLYKVKELNEGMIDLSKYINEFINESLINESFDKDDIEEIDMRLEELKLERSDFYPYNKVPYKADSDIADWLMEMSDDVIEKPFDSIAKKVLKAFKIDPNNVEVFRHVVFEDFDNAELIVYTPKGESPEGEDHDFAVEDVFIND